METPNPKINELLNDFYSNLELIVRKAVAEELKKTFPKVILTREPGATALGKTLRGLILDGHLSDRAEFFLFAADRAQHCAERIRPALLENALVISDRMPDSSLIYQGIRHGFRIAE